MIFAFVVSVQSALEGIPKTEKTVELAWLIPQAILKV